MDRAADLLDLRYAVPALPFGLQLTGVRPADDGVDVRVEATTRSSASRGIAARAGRVRRGR